MNYAPIALFTYARPIHTERVIDSLLKNPEASSSELFIFCDAAKNPSHQSAVSEVRRIAHQASGFRKVAVIERERNLGLANSIISGVTQVLNNNQKIIVLEDDLVLSPLFLSFMNQGLVRYQDANDVASIHGYCYPLAHKPHKPFFLRGADCWGWATWARAWDQFNSDGKQLMRQLDSSGEMDLFDFRTKKQYSRMLQDQIAGKNDSWAIRWYASMFLAKKYTLYPAESYVANLGHDGSGSHCGESTNFNVELATSLPDSWPDLIQDDAQMRFAFSQYLNREAQSGTISQKVWRKAISFLHKIRGM